ncbi:HNH endonuclease [Gordonia tangerina]|uniref:HNH endonuclease n=1 Tax=Gordonia tangerina TaxID=2911060 RepID=A0ABS9DEX5_9ACTN|nr:hypothetical protein [Gordonia tangerina]MCF3937177.1 hypothetical protein [Gordonia tangerina]
MTSGTPIDPDDPIAPDRRPWWKPRKRLDMNREMSGQHLIAAYLWHNRKIGEVFTMRELRVAIGEDGKPNDDEHLNRRLRALKDQGWLFSSYKSREGQNVEDYILDAKGARTWLGEKVAKRDAVSAKTRREVFERDGNRCVICGRGAGEPYDEDQPEVTARLTIGHRVAGARLADASADNLRTECARCNEPVNDSPPDPETYRAVMAEVRRLPSAERRRLLEWIDAGWRLPTKTDQIWDRVRRLAVSEKKHVAEELRNGLT